MWNFKRWFLSTIISQVESEFRWKRLWNNQLPVADAPFIWWCTGFGVVQTCIPEWSQVKDESTFVRYKTSGFILSSFVPVPYSTVNHHHHHYSVRIIIIIITILILLILIHSILLLGWLIHWFPNENITDRHTFVSTFQHLIQHLIQHSSELI